MTFSASLQFGKIGEGRIATWLRARGCSVLPVYEKEIHEGKGPTLFSVEGQLIAPDLLAFRTGHKQDVKWIEAKTKSAFTWHRNTGCWTTGIDVRHYGDYLKVAGLSPWPVWLLFLHLQGQAKDSPQGSPVGLFGNELTYLSQHEHHRSDRWGCRGMVYWAHGSLRRLATLGDVLIGTEA